MGAEGSEGIEGTGAEGTGARATGAVVGGAEGTDGGIDGAGAGGSSVTISSRLILVWSRRGKMKGMRPGPPSIDSKGGLIAAATLQSGLDWEPDVL